MRAGSLVPAVTALTVLGLVFTVLGLFFRVRFAGAALFALAAEYVLVEAAGRANTFSIVAYAAGLVVLAELLFWLGQLPASALVDRRAVTLWLRNVVALAVAGALLALLALVASGYQLPGTLAGTLVGCAAAAVLLTLPWLLLKKRGERDQRRG